MYCEYHKRESACPRPPKIMQLYFTAAQCYPSNCNALFGHLDVSRLLCHSSHVIIACSAASTELSAQNATAKLCLPNIRLVSVYGAL